MSKLNRAVGFFDCREYKKGTKRSERKMAAEGSRVNFSVGLAESELTDEIREFARLHEKSGKHFVAFKVFPKNCKAYTASAKEVAFPTNDKIDGGQFEVNIDFSVKHGTGTELNGLYANKIQFIRKVDNSFEAVEDGDDSMFDGTATAQAAPVQGEAVTEESSLPF
jgi:hypothetical protein